MTLRATAKACRVVGAQALVVTGRQDMRPGAHQADDALSQGLCAKPRLLYHNMSQDGAPRSWRRSCHHCTASSGVPADAPSHASLTRASAILVRSSSRAASACVTRAASSCYCAIHSLASPSAADWRSATLRRAACSAAASSATIAVSSSSSVLSFAILAS